MTITYTDSLGPAVDTGESVQSTVRPNTTIETHIGVTIDTGSTLTQAKLLASHVPQRPAVVTR